MTGFDPTAPNRDTERDEEPAFEDNVVPPEELTDGDVGSDEGRAADTLPAERPGPTEDV